MTAPLCRYPYKRPDGNVLPCQYLANHPSPNHSWFAVRVQDDADREVNAERIDYSPTAIRAILGGIARGDADIYLEAILEIAHHRKRALRGVRSFDDLMRDDG